jgi:hypothetical protein
MRVRANSAWFRITLAILGRRHCDLGIWRYLTTFDDLEVMVMATGGGIARNSHAAGRNASNEPPAPQLLTIGH